MQVKEVMTKDVITVTPETSLRDIGKIFKDKRISGVPVVNSKDELIGIVTITDLLRIINDIYHWSRFEEKDIGLQISKEFEDEKNKATASSTMTRMVYTVEEDTNMKEILRLMFNNNVHTIPVTKDRKLVGVIGVRDVIASYF